MPTKPKPLSGKWLEAIKLKPDELTAYVAKHPMKLNNVIIKNESISKSTINGAEFINTDWDDSFAKETLISNTIFKDGDIYDTSFARSTLTNVTFEGMDLDKIEFVNAKLINVTFKKCRIQNSNFSFLHMSKVLFEDTEMKDISFYQSEVDLTFKRVNVHQSGNFRKLKTGSKITIEDSFIGNNSEFDYSNLVSFTVKNSTIENSKMNNAIVDEIIIEDTEMDFPIANSTLNKVRMRAINLVKLGGSKINTLMIEDCKENRGINLYDTVFKSISIRNCPTEEMDISDAKGEKLQITQMDILKADFSKLFVKELKMNNITISRKADFSAAMAEESLVTNFSIKAGAQVKMDGTNIKFQ